MTRLKPVIASYSGASYAAISRYLTEDVLDIVADVAHAPKPRSEIPSDVLAELTEMHVLVERDGIVMPDTAVFLRDDVREAGTLTVFYENDVELIRELLI